MSEPKPVEGALLLCLDLQPVFLKSVHGGLELLKRCEFAISAAKLLGVPVAFTEQVPEKLGGTEPALLSRVENPEVHAKDSFSALGVGTPVRMAVTGGKHIEHLIVCGVETPICVFQTVVDALQAGIEVTVLSDCVGARRPADAATALDALARAGAHVVPSETVFYTILRGAKHPAFKAFTELVKIHG
jgi:nicotinamidase-related amidase